jgi:hypothetical protein
MAQFDLRFQVPASVTSEMAEHTLYWPTNGPGSFNTPFGPRLGALGAVPPGNLDLFRLAAMVYAADRSVPRQAGQVNWTRRSFTLTVPVRDPEPWTAVADDLCQWPGLGPRWWPSRSPRSSSGLISS